MLSYAVGRIGCHVAGDGDWGIVNNNPKPSFLPDWLWAYNYPNNVNGVDTKMTDCIYNDQYCYQLAEPVYPTPLYETAMCLVIFGILWYYRKKIIVPGVLFFMYLAFNGVERFLIEQIRVNEKYNFAGMSFTQAQLISSLLIIIGITGIIILLKRHKKRLSDAGSGSS
jgi:prolipoprotein diacylglyceryltransferase